MHTNKRYNIMQAPTVNSRKWVVIFGQRTGSGHAAPGAVIVSNEMTRDDAILMADYWDAHVVDVAKTYRTECGHGRCCFHPDWDKSKPWATYVDGTAGRHLGGLEACAQYFASRGMFLKTDKA